MNRFLCEWDSRASSTVTLMIGAFTVSAKLRVFPRSMGTTNPTGLLLVNLGTPKSPKPSDVRPYLREFLSDPRVLDMPAVRRFLVLNLLILPFRPKKSGEAYEKIWT